MGYKTALLDWSGCHVEKRSVGRPETRWTDDLRIKTGVSWMHTAQYWVGLSLVGGGLRSAVNSDIE